LRISQGSVVTVLRRGGKKLKHLHHVSATCCVANLIKITVTVINENGMFLKHSVFEDSRNPCTQQTDRYDQWTNSSQTIRGTL